MASSTPLALILFPFTPFLFLLTPQIQAQNSPASAPATPSIDPINLIGILENSGEYTIFINLLQETQLMNKIQSQLNSTSEGFTIISPTNNGFQNLKYGSINNLTNQQKVQLLLYHIVPKFYTLSQLLTVSNPVLTQASGNNGTWKLNFISHGNQVNIYTGVVETSINNALRQEFPLAIYQVEKVLLPLELFRADSPPSPPSPSSPSPSPSPSLSPKSSKTPSEPESSINTTDAGEAPSSPSDDTKDGAVGRNGGLGLVVGLGLIYMGAIY